MARANLDDDSPARLLPLPTEVPLFPLPDHVLLPGAPSPYRVFEPRYRALIQDVLDTCPEDERWLAVPRLAPGWREDYHGSPPIHEVATVGRIVRCEPLAGGHFFILVEGHERVLLTERRSDLPYRVAGVTPVPDRPLVPGDARRVAVLSEGIAQAVYTLSQLLGPAADELAAAAADRSDLAAMTFRIASAAIDTPDERQEVLEERSLPERARLVLDALTHVVAMAGRHVGAAPLA